MQELNPPEVLEGLKNKTFDPKTLDVQSRRCIVDYLFYKVIPNETKIAERLKVHRNTIVKDMAAIRSEKSQNTKFSTEVMGTEYFFHSQTIFEKLMANKKYKEAHDVLTKTLDVLQSLGFVFKKPVEMNVSLEDKAKQWEAFFGLPSVDVGINNAKTLVN